MENSRDFTIDFTRGFAIMIMIMANMGPLLVGPHPLIFRLVGSMAAPIFTTLAGMMVGQYYRKRNFKFYFKRGIELIIWASFLDLVCYAQWPLVSADVLYMIGLSLPFCYLCAHFKMKRIYYQMILVALVTVVFHFIFNYREKPTELLLNAGPMMTTDVFFKIVKNYLFDGWFPLFPWMLFPLYGLILAKVRWKYKSLRTTYFYFSILAVIFGSVVWGLLPGNHYTREGYSELFYPVTFGSVIFCLGLIFILLNIFDRLEKKSLYKKIARLGQHSLFIYVMHSLVIAALHKYLGQTLQGINFIIFYVGLISLMYSLVALKIYWTKKRIFRVERNTPELKKSLEK